MRNEVIDESTGEVFDVGELRFSCFRHTDGVKWVSLLNYNQLRAMHYLAWKMSNNGTIHLSGKKKSDMMLFLEVKERQYNKILSQLMSLDMIRRITNGHYMVNPSVIFRGSASSFGFKVREYNNLKYKK